MVCLSGHRPMGSNEFMEYTSLPCVLRDAEHSVALRRGSSEHTASKAALALRPRRIDRISAVDQPPGSHVTNLHSIWCKVPRTTINIVVETLKNIADFKLLMLTDTLFEPCTISFFFYRVKFLARNYY